MKKIPCSLEPCDSITVDNVADTGTQATGGEWLVRVVINEGSTNYCVYLGRDALVKLRKQLKKAQAQLAEMPI